MSHETTTRPLLIIEPESEWGDSITSTVTNLNYFYVPSIPQWAYSEYDGLIYEGVEYNWAEVDYRLSVEYSGVPEPSIASLGLGLFVMAFIVYKKIFK
mgnify:CR=1 FL=1|tara:strand:- start:351 stop:644 length:294 start_codon:yes stop_codon:yes gene_type:complete